MSHTPITESQEDVRRCVPCLFAAIEESGAVCKCKAARGVALVVDFVILLCSSDVSI